MKDILPGRFTAEPPKDYVVFLIGMRVNFLWAFSSWIPAARAMTKMLAELKKRPEMGLRHYESFFSWRTFFFVQYWDDFGKLEAFARARDLPHAPAWAEFNRRVGTNGKVGIFHETFVVRGAETECIYNNMPRFGLAKAFAHLPVARKGESAAKRIGSSGKDDPLFPVPK